jgi:hypothetical protein
MSMRTHYNYEEQEAARILDLARAGGDVPKSTITWALWILGDLVGASHA